MTLRVGVLQATGVVGLPQHNLDRIAAHAREARALGADLLVTPELFVAGYAPALVHGQDGTPHRAQLADIAASAGVALVASTVEHEAGTHYISASFFGPDGAELTRYRKQNLFGPVEKQAFTPGTAPSAIMPFGGVNIALGICFDIEFPEFARAAAVAGAELLCVPTAVPLRAADPGGADNPFDTRLIPSMVVPTRALENQLFIAYANHSGPDFAGLSTIADPYGRRLSTAAGTDQLILADVDPGILRQARNDTGYLAHLTISTPPAGARTARLYAKGPQ